MNFKSPLLNDVFHENKHPFPADFEALLRRIAAFDGKLIDTLDPRYFASWQAGVDLNSGRAMLRAIAAYVDGQGKTAL